jgi:hypothetical protein
MIGARRRYKSTISNRKVPYPMAKHRKLTMSAARVTVAGAGVALGGLALIGGTPAFAGTPAQADHAAPIAAAAPADSASTGANSDGPSQSQSLVDLSHNLIPIQVCHNQVPVNVLGVQVPVQDVTGALGLGILGAAGTAPAATDSSCHLPAAQNN